jgi:hypothetical protein
MALLSGSGERVGAFDLGMMGFITFSKQQLNDKRSSGFSLVKSISLVHQSQP